MSDEKGEKLDRESEGADAPRSSRAAGSEKDEKLAAQGEGSAGPGVGGEGVTASEAGGVADEGAAGAAAGDKGAAGTAAADAETAAEAGREAEAEADAEAAEEPRPRRRRRRGAAETTTRRKQEAPAPGERRRDPSEGPVVVRARAKYVRCAPRKARLVIDHIRGKSVEEARTILTHTPRPASRDVLKVLNSCVANAEHNHELLADELRVHQAYVDEGPTIKRYRPRALGRATRIRKRTSHMTISLISE